MVYKKPKKCYTLLYQETLASVENYEPDENHYLLIWNDPLSMEIRDEKQLRNLLNECAKYEEQETWLLCGMARTYDEAQSKDIDEIIAHLNAERDITVGEMRNPSPQSVTDPNGYVRIRRIYNACKEEQA